MIDAYNLQLQIFNLWKELSISVKGDKIERDNKPIVVYAKIGGQLKQVQGVSLVNGKIVLDMQP
jgi:hypothetical protein